MSEALIQARALSKTYRLYDKPFHRFLDAFGLLPAWLSKYREHNAVDDLNLEIRAGEKLAVIGRNGAGKSTLLKMLGGVTQPTSGSLSVKGEICALLTLGAGFHQDFTGRENVNAYLAQLGMSDRDIQAIFMSIVDFAELHDYIDQPLKTYSTGMAMRLGFAVSTVIKPEILIIDEVLSVGDAYFFKKSYERIREMCAADGTTLIMVTHDLYAAMTMCDRAVWLDEGRIRADGLVKEVINAYEISIKEQEEQRLRHKWRDAVTDNAQGVSRILLGDIKTAGGETVADGLRVSALRFLDGSQELATLAMDDTAQDSTKGGLIVNQEEANWGDSIQFNGRLTRLFAAYGSVYQKLPFYLSDSRVIAAYDREALTIQVDYHAQSGQHFKVSLREADDRAAVIEAEFLAEPSKWRSATVAMRKRTGSSASSGVSFARYGQRTIEITHVRFQDETGTESLQFRTGGTFHAEIAYRINDPNFDEAPTVLIAFQKDGAVRTHRLVTQDVRLRAQDGLDGVLRVTADPIMFTAGTYLLNVAIFAEGFFESGDTKKFFTVNDRLYDMHSRAYEIVVHPVPEKPLWNDVAFLHPSLWTNDILDTRELFKRSMPDALPPPAMALPDDLSQCQSETLSLDQFQEAEAITLLDETGALRGRTTRNNSYYAVISGDIETQSSHAVRCLVVSMGVERGCMAVNLYDPETDSMLVGETCEEGQSRQIILPIPQTPCPRRLQLIVSNNVSGDAAQSDFTLHAVQVLRASANP